MNVAENIAKKISDRVAQISVANGYETDIGAHVFRGRLFVDESRLPCVVILEGNDTVESNGASSLVKLGQAYTLEAHLPCDADHPNDAAHAAIRDLKKALFGGGKKLDGLARDITYAGRNIAPREDGVKLVAGAIHISVSYAEDLTAP